MVTESITAYPGPVLFLAGEIDLTVQADIAAQLELLADLPAPTVVTVDLSTVTFMDCAGLLPLLVARCLLDGRLRLQGAGRPVRRLLGHLDLMRLLDPQEV